MKTEKFKITRDIGSGIFFTEVDGERMTIEGVECFVFREGKEVVNVSHIETGYCVAYGPNKKVAIQRAKNNISRFPAALKAGIKEAKKAGIKLPVNEPGQKK